ncbi:MAG: bifunctional diaminohydroxyphosphoribosylaminopyrimidine deaminase/5-amino-6-(5-phosphoribosylamino)uracil reductase RibD [Candidatus Aminicenantia bacterium]
MEIDELYMKVALNLAEKGKGLTSPNPVVGAVVLKDRKIVGKGYHKKAGEPHAEVIALEEARENAVGATLYVNLEPCIHWGRTPPCAERIKIAKIKKVVVGTIDPNPIVNTKGIEYLRSNGIETEVGVLEREAKELNLPFFKSITKKLPFVALKMAMTLDGKVATWKGDSKWISNEESRKYVHLLRSEFDAIVVGAGTIIIDNPLLTIRYGKEKEILRVILDPSLRVPENSSIFNTLDKGKIIIFTGKIKEEKFSRIKKKGIEIIPIEGEGEFSLRWVLHRLNEMGVNSVLCEGGHTLSTSLIKEHLVDRVFIFISPNLTGGKNAPTFFEGEGFSLISDSLKLKNVKQFFIGEDTVIIGDIKCSQE